MSKENRDETQRDEETTDQAMASAGGDAAKGAPLSGSDADLDLEDLDLTVETVEERISPSETNVFDK